jgi:hypothetical protein
LSILGNASFQRATALVTVLALGLTLSPAALASQAAQAAAESAVIDINHDPLACVAPEYAPKVDAAVAPGPQVRQGLRLLSRGQHGDYYYAGMDRPAQTLAAILPRPLRDEAVDYHTGLALRPRRKKANGHLPSCRGKPARRARFPSAPRAPV